MTKFYRGAKLRESRVLEVAQEAFRPGSTLTLGECIYATLDVRRQRYGDITKADLLRLVDRAWDAYAAALKEFPDNRKGEP